MRGPGCALLACGPATLLLLCKLVACLLMGSSRCEMKQMHGSLPCHRFCVQPVHLTCCRQAAAAEVIATTAAAMPNRERGYGCMTAAALLLHSVCSPSTR